VSTTEQDLLQRITANPEIFGGKPIIRDIGESVDSILSDYPDLEPEDVRACLAYAMP
jgi:uncharacterized protein (DUF433 family)